MHCCSANEVDGSSSDVLCLWTRPSCRVFAASGWLLRCHTPRDVDDNVVYCPEREVILKRTVRKKRLDCYVHCLWLGKGDGFWSSGPAWRRQEAGTAGSATLWSFLPEVEQASQRFIWHPNESEYDTRPFYSGVWARIKTCAAGAKILDPVGIPLMRRLRHQPINLVLHTSKHLGVHPLPKAKVTL